MRQNTYILDTNVYGELLIEKKGVEIISRIDGDKTLRIYGIDIIEQELQDVPSDKKIKGAAFRELVLSVYRSLIDEEFLLSPLANYLSSEYYRKYAKLRKSGRYYFLAKAKEMQYNEADLRVDFGIIAVASLKVVDVVVTADKRTMLSRLATETYSAVNRVNGLKTPNLVDYFEFRRRYIK